MTWLTELALTSVSCTRLLAEVEAERREEFPAALSVIPSAPYYRKTILGLDVRAGIEVEYRDAESYGYARLEAETLVSFIAPDDEDLGEPSEEQIEEFIQSIAKRVAFPYLREAIHSMAAKCGMLEIVFDLVSETSMQPRSVRVGDTRFFSRDAPEENGPEDD